MRAWTGAAGTLLLAGAETGSWFSISLDLFELGGDFAFVQLGALGERRRDLGDLAARVVERSAHGQIRSADKVQILGDLAAVARERQRVVDVTETEEHDSARKRADQRLDTGILSERESEDRGRERVSRKECEPVQGSAPHEVVEAKFTQWLFPDS